MRPSLEIVSPVRMGAGAGAGEAGMGEIQAQFQHRPFPAFMQITQHAND